MGIGAELLDEVIDRAVNALVVVDIKLNLIKVNAGGRLILMTAELPGNICTYTNDRGCESLRQTLANTFAGQPLDRKTLSFRRGDGQDILVQVGASLVQWQGQPHLLMELEGIGGIESEGKSFDLLKNAVHSANDAIMITTPTLNEPHPIIEYVNPAFCRMTGWEAKDIIGRSPRVLQGPKTSREVLDRLKHDVETTGTFSGEAVNYRKDGSDYHLEWRITPLVGTDGQTTHLLASQRDVSERNEQMEEIKRLNATLEQRVTERTQELEDLNRELQSFSYTVSHDLRSPLRSILGFSAALKEDYGDSLGPEGNDYVDRMSGAARRMDALIDAILNLSRLSHATLDRKEVDLTAMAHLVAEDLRSAFPDVAFEVEGGLKPVADEGSLRVILHNLMENGAKFSASSSNPKVTLSQVMRDGRRYFQVADNGIGFDSAKATEIFLPFEQLYAAGIIQGSGIGLATVSRIVKRHQGRVFAESTPGSGARFLFTLVPL